MRHHGGSGPGSDIRLGRRAGWWSVTGHRWRCTLRTMDSSKQATSPVWWPASNTRGLKSNVSPGGWVIIIEIKTAENSKLNNEYTFCSLIVSVLIDLVDWAFHCKKDFPHFRLNWILPSCNPCVLKPSPYKMNVSVWKWLPVFPVTVGLFERQAWVKFHDDELEGASAFPWLYEYFNN